MCLHFGLTTPLHVCVRQDYEDALSRVHFKAEGDVEFKALLFIPQRAPWDFYDNIQRPKTSGGKSGRIWRGESDICRLTM